MAHRNGEGFVVQHRRSVGYGPPPEHAGRRDHGVSKRIRKLEEEWVTIHFRNRKVILEELSIVRCRLQLGWYCWWVTLPSLAPRLVTIQQTNLTGIARISLSMPEAGTVQTAHVFPVDAQRPRFLAIAAGTTSGMEQRQVAGRREAEAVVGDADFQVDFSISWNGRRLQLASDALRVVEADR